MGEGGGRAGRCARRGERRGRWGGWMEEEKKDGMDGWQTDFCRVGCRLALAGVRAGVWVLGGGWLQGEERSVRERRPAGGRPGGRTVGV